MTYICGIPRDQYEVIRLVAEPPRWCFGERRRQAGIHYLKRPRREYLDYSGAWGWADPFWTYKCNGCGQDRRLGFGWVWEPE